MANDPLSTTFIEGMTTEQLATTLADSDLANMTYAQLLNRLSADLPTLMPLSTFPDSGTGINNTIAAGSKPTGANVVNTNVMTAASMVIASNAGGSALTAGTNVQFTNTLSYDPNGWWNGTNFTVPAGGYVIDWEMEGGGTATASTASALWYNNGTASNLHANGMSTPVNQFFVLTTRQILNLTTTTQVGFGVGVGAAANVTFESAHMILQRIN